MKNRKTKFMKNENAAKKVDLLMKKIQDNENKKTKTDPNGSYTGVADPPFENVVQDVDDL